MRKKGFTLVEFLIGTALSLIVISAGLGFFSLAQRTFIRLKEREECGQAALAALDRMRIDLLHAGYGLAQEMEIGLVEAAQVAGDELRTVRLERALTLAGEARAGDTRLPLASAASIAAGQEIALRDGLAGEVRTVAAAGPGAVSLREPLERDYSPASAAVSLLERVVYFLDGPQHILRRRVNGGSAQPVLENAAAAAWQYDPGTRLVRVRLELGIEGAPAHETTVFLKNPALAGISR